MRRLKIAVGEVDRDALLALGRQPIDQQRVVDVTVDRSVTSAIAFECLQGVVRDMPAFGQQTADQGRLAVVHAAAGQHAQDRFRHQK